MRCLERMTIWVKICHRGWPMQESVGIAFPRRRLRRRRPRELLLLPIHPCARSPCRPGLLLLLLLLAAGANTECRPFRICQEISPPLESCLMGRARSAEREALTLYFPNPFPAPPLPARQALRRGSSAARSSRSKPFRKWAFYVGDGLSLFPPSLWFHI